MENVKSKIKKLWQHLRISDDELLIVREDTDDTEDYIIAAKEEKEITLTKAVFKKGTKERQTEFLGSLDKPFTMVQQRNGNGMFYVPDVNDWRKDEEADY